MSKGSQYAQLGVEADKSAVRQAFSAAIRNDYPGAFVNIARHPLFPEYVKTQHADGDGSKSTVRLLMYLITGDVSWFDGMIDDAFSMNMGDIAASGFVTGDISITDTLNVNRFNMPKDELMACMSRRLGELQQLYSGFGFPSIDFMGGETADLPRQVQSSVFDMTVHAVMPASGVIAGNVQPGDRIWGFASDGQAVWEKSKNSGIMSNGLTLAASSLLLKHYTETHPQVLLAGATFKGVYPVQAHDKLIEGTIGEALLSPTRQWALVIKLLIDKLRETGELHLLHGISMNTGGGATKCRSLSTGGVLIKKKMPAPPGIFALVQREPNEIWKNMYETFNCGIGLDIIGSAGLEKALKYVEERTGVVLHDLGSCQESITEENHVVLETPFGKFDY